METEGTQIHILGDVLVAVASLDLKVPTKGVITTRSNRMKLRLQ